MSTLINKACVYTVSPNLIVVKIIVVLVSLYLDLEDSTSTKELFVISLNLIRLTTL